MLQGMNNNWSDLIHRTLSLSLDPGNKVQHSNKNHNQLLLDEKFVTQQKSSACVTDECLAISELYYFHKWPFY